MEQEYEDYNSKARPRYYDVFSNHKARTKCLKPCKKSKLVFRLLQVEIYALVVVH